MSHSSDFARLERIGDFLADIQMIIARHGSTDAALNDREGQYALMLCIGQIGELLGKITTSELVAQLPIRLAKGMRNVIFHHYDDLNLSDVEKTILESLPTLNESIQKILNEEA